MPATALVMSSLESKFHRGVALHSAMIEEEDLSWQWPDGASAHVLGIVVLWLKMFHGFVNKSALMKAEWSVLNVEMFHRRDFCLD